MLSGEINLNNCGFNRSIKEIKLNYQKFEWALNFYRN